MVGAGFACVWAAFRVFGCVEVAKVLEVVIFLHVVVDWWALPVSSFKFAVFGALLCDLDFAVACVSWASIFFWHSGQMLLVLLTLTIPTMASTISANGSRIIDMVIMRSYFRTFCNC